MDNVDKNKSNKQSLFLEELLSKSTHIQKISTQKVKSNEDARK
jgi:hypothetical protein